MPPSLAARPEHWAADAGTRDVVQLIIPPDADRDRHFELFCRLEVNDKSNSGDAWHELRVTVNGSQEWLRREPTLAGSRDSLDYRFRRTVPLGEPLRVVASSKVKLALRLNLSISADEDLRV